MPCPGVETGGSSLLFPHCGKCEPAALWADASGPGLLKEDRQKPRLLFDGMHGTRNTVPSIAEIRR
jgi:hypothetical protein